MKNSLNLIALLVLFSGASFATEPARRTFDSSDSSGLSLKGDASPVVGVEGKA